jgi:hypothetical protein
MLANEDDMQLLASAGVSCESCQAEDPRLKQSNPNIIVIISTHEMYSFGGGVFRPQAPQSILPPEVKNGGTTWAIVLNGRRFQKADRSQQIAHQVVLWFTTKWDEVKDGCLPWGPLPSGNNQLNRKKSAGRRPRSNSEYFC